ncbi:MAG: helix-turn-helix transcriptional regulator [Rhodospirillaceae bacterium]|nr:helix-turn-helix transcriptional regulator [Rhodospirillaceae bacterium]
MAVTAAPTEPGQEAHANHSVGSELRALRKAHGLTIAELALALGRSVGWLSQVERGVNEPAIRDLRRAAEFFGLPMGFFFHNDDAPSQELGIVVRAATRRPLGNNEEGLVEELLSPDLTGGYEVVRSVFAPGAELAERVTRRTEEFGYIIAGTFDMEISGTWFCLEPGDSFRFKEEPYRWRNAGEVEAVVIWIISPPIY